MPVAKELIVENGWERRLDYDKSFFLLETEVEMLYKHVINNEDSDVISSIFKRFAINCPKLYRGVALSWNEINSLKL